MYQYIVNPNTNRKVNINSKLGKKVLNKYINLIGGSFKFNDTCYLGNICGPGLSCARTKGKSCGPRKKYPHVSPLNPKGKCKSADSVCHCLPGNICADKETAQNVRRVLK